MTAMRELSRPPSQHRPSTGAGSIPTQKTVSRTHSHSVSLGSVNRVNRRKSSSTLGSVNIPALAAAAKEASQARAAVDGLGIALGTSAPANESPLAQRSNSSGSAVVDGPPLASLAGRAKLGSRRASEGGRATKERTRSNAGELKCETCGKGYKHGSCLTKHLWEHTPEWSLTSKLLISKHQQVQMLEAASVLVTMNQDPEQSDFPAPMERGSSSESPVPSASSDPLEDEDEASSRTSTPSQDEFVEYKPRNFSRPRRQDSVSSVFSRSYQSTSATSFAPSSAPDHQQPFVSYARRSSQSRPSTAYGEEPDVTAAAEGLVSCSLGTPNIGAAYMPSDIPPVPALPAKFANEYHRSSIQKPLEIDMINDEDEVGVFGRMES